MKKSLVLLAFALLMCLFTTVFAGPITRNAAQETAVAFLNANSPLRSPITAEQLQSVPLETEYPNLFAFNVDGGGFIIVSNDDRTRPILGYSVTGSLNLADLPPALTELLKLYDKQLQMIADGSEAVPYNPHRNSRSVAPLLTAAWWQAVAGDELYNTLCPYDSTLENLGGHPTVGCAALSLGQVMRYWRWPIRGTGTNCYSYDGQYDCWTYDTLCVDFDVAYDWTNMPNSLSVNSTQVQRLAVATLLYHCGVAMNMNYNIYCEGSSAASVYRQYYGAIHHFGYSSRAIVAERADYPDSEWQAMLINELDSARPVLYAGFDYQSGHSFVLDGYDNNDLFHINWGLGGVYDGYFSLNAFIVGQSEFLYSQQAILGFQPADSQGAPLTEMLDDITLDTNQVQMGAELSGHTRLANIGTAPDDFYVAQAVYSNRTDEFCKWIDVQHITIQPGDTLNYEFNSTIDLPVGDYYTLMYRSNNSIDLSSTSIAGTMEYPTFQRTYEEFWVKDSCVSEVYNLVIFVRFDGEDEIEYDFATIDSMFNCNDGVSPSIYNYYTVSTYDQIHFHTIYANATNGEIHSYVAQHPRGYYEPYSETNPTGYLGENPFIGISMREAELIAEVVNYVDDNHLIAPDQVLDGNEDGYIDNISFIIKGGTGAWASIMWPHMEYFPMDSVDFPVAINGKLPHAFNFEFEGAPSALFSVDVFRHEMGHSLGLPDLYHYVNYPTVDPAYTWDMMGNNYVMNQTSAILKNKYLHVGGEPIRITEDGTYTLYSNATSHSENCYYIKSSIDTNQWYVFEYRNKEDLFDEGIPETGMIIGRWCDTIPANYDGMLANPFFDFANKAHQYWVFRPGSNNDTIQGDIERAAFSAASGRDGFDMYSDPYPYLTDGTPDYTFVVYSIQENGESLTFSVEFRYDNVNAAQLPKLSVYPNPTNGKFFINSPLLDVNSEVQVFDAFGRMILKENLSGGQNEIDLNRFSSGVYVVKVTNEKGQFSTTKVIKR